jgi:hypothetical protein
LQSTWVFYPSDNKKMPPYVNRGHFKCLAVRFGLS